MALLSVHHTGQNHEGCFADPGPKQPRPFCFFHSLDMQGASLAPILIQAVEYWTYAHRVGCKKSPSFLALLNPPRLNLNLPAPPAATPSCSVHSHTAFGADDFSTKSRQRLLYQYWDTWGVSILDFIKDRTSKRLSQIFSLVSPGLFVVFFGGGRGGGWDLVLAYLQNLPRPPLDPFWTPGPTHSDRFRGGSVRTPAPQGSEARGVRAEFFSRPEAASLCLSLLELCTYMYNIYIYIHM